MASSMILAASASYPSADSSNSIETLPQMLSSEQSSFDEHEVSASPSASASASSSTASATHTSSVHVFPAAHAISSEQASPVAAPVSSSTTSAAHKRSSPQDSPSP